MLLPVAFRSLSRLSSALSAKASTLRSSSLNQRIERIKLVQFRVHSVAHLSFVFVNYFKSFDLLQIIWYSHMIFSVNQLKVNQRPRMSSLGLSRNLFSVFGFQGSKRKTKSFPNGLKWTLPPRRRISLSSLVGLSGLEPPTSRLSGVRSNQLSYKPISTLRVAMDIYDIVILFFRNIRRADS